MHPSTHPPTRDAASSWSDPATGAKKPKKRAKKKATKKKSAAKKTSTAKKTPKKAAKKTPAKKASKKTAKKIPAKKAAARKPAPFEPTPPAVAALRRELTALKRQVADLSDTLGRLTTTFTDLHSDEEVVDNPFARFLDATAIERLRGQHVAIHETSGIIAHGFELDDVFAALRARDVPLDEIALHFIAATPF